MNTDELQSEQAETEAPVAEATESEDAAQAEEGATDEVTSTPEPADAALSDEESETS